MEGSVKEKSHIPIVDQKKFRWKSCLFSIRKTGKSLLQVRCRNFSSAWKTTFPLSYSVVHMMAPPDVFSWSSRPQANCEILKAVVKQNCHPLVGFSACRTSITGAGQRKGSRGKGYPLTLQIFLLIMKPFCASLHLGNQNVY